MAMLSMISKVLSKVKQALVRLDLVIVVAACSVLLSMERSLSNFLQLSQVALLSFLCLKVAEHGQAFWWMAQPLETVAEKANHLEMRAMYENLLGHECVRQMYQWFFNYDSSVSDIYWFLHKVCSELSCLRLASLRRGMQISLNAESLVLRYVRERIFAEHGAGLEGSVRALANWDRFDEWCREHEAAEVIRRLGQPDPVRHHETTRLIETYVIRDDGHHYFWSFRG